VIAAAVGENAEGRAMLCRCTIRQMKSLVIRCASRLGMLTLAFPHRIRFANFQPGGKLDGNGE